MNSVGTGMHMLRIKGVFDGSVHIFLNSSILYFRKEIYSETGYPLACMLLDVVVVWDMDLCSSDMKLPSDWYCNEA